MDKVIKTLKKIKNTIPEKVKDFFRKTSLKNIPSYVFEKLELDNQIIKASELKFRSLTELSISAIILTDGNDKIDLWNGSAENMFGWKAKEVIGKPLTIIAPEESVKGDKYNFRQILKNKDPKNLNKNMESSGVRNNGEVFPLEISFSSWKVGDKLFFCYIVRDITSRRKIEKDLAIKKKKLENLVSNLNIFKLALDNAFVHIVITDKNGFIVYANKATEEITGYDHKEIIGKTPALWGKQMPAPFYEDFWQTIKIEKKNYTGEIINKRKNGELYQAEIRVSPVLDEEREVEFFVAIERDITEEREMDKAKTEFISLAAHQLRTPLSTISLTTELLLKGVDGEMSKENKKYLKGIFLEVSNMTEMIETFLNVSRIEMGKFPVETESIGLSTVIDKIIKDVLPQINDKKINFIKDYNKKLPILNLDKRIITIILENLLSNAIKYTPQNGKITLCIKEKNGDVEIKVIDNGIGIPEYEQTKIFTKMFRANNVSSIKSEGSGLGLYLVKNLAIQSGYDISFISKENEGTTFIFKIPKSIKIQKRFVNISKIV